MDRYIEANNFLLFGALTVPNVTGIIMRKASSVVTLMVLGGSLVCASAARAKTECHESPGYLVIEHTRNDSFSDFIIKEKRFPGSKILCAFKADTKDFKIGGKGRFYAFVALSGHLLMLQEENGGAVSDQGLVLYDLKMRKLKDKVGSHGGVEEANERSVVFWRPADDEPTKENCEEYAKYLDGGDHEGMPGIQAKWTFDFASEKATRSSEKRCVLLAD